MKVKVFLAKGFEEIEVVTPVDIWRRAGFDVSLVSVTGENIVKGANGISLVADILFENENFDDEFLLFLPGGLPGANNLEAHEGLQALIAQQAEKKAEIAAICAAPYILGKQGILKGKTAICYPGFEGELEGATLATGKVAIDGNIVTGKAPGAAIPFALAIVEKFKNKEAADALVNGMFLA